MNRIVMRLPCFFLILCSCLIMACNSSVDPSFSREETLTPELKPLRGIAGSVIVKVKPSFLILHKTLSQTDSSDGVSFIADSLYVTDAMNATSGLVPNGAEYYADPDMKRVYVNDSRVVFCYGYKKQIDFMDFKFNLINRVKFEFAAPKHIDLRSREDVNLSYICSYLGKRYFYTLYLGISSNKRTYLSSQGTFLEVYDLDGNPVIRYLLNGGYPVYFAVDEKTFTLYGPQAYDDPEDHMLVYKLKGLKNSAGTNKMLSK
jgi:hypothetical protein